jgi:2-hydroxychromene-2-carboxylate isomerase
MAASRTITYYFSMLSPWAYIGQAVFNEIVARHKLKVIYKPVFLPDLFGDSGGVVLAKRHPLRLRYRWLEMQRWREKRGLKFALKPKFWPFDLKLADAIVVAICAASRDPNEFMLRVFRGAWEQDLNCADEATLADMLKASGFDAPAMLAAAKSDTVAKIYASHHQDALDDGAFGSPVYVLDGEAFWGQDRLDLLDDALKSGRKAFAPPA